MNSKPNVGNFNDINSTYKLVSCIFFLLFFFLSYGVIQERIMTTEYGKADFITCSL